MRTEDLNAHMQAMIEWAEEVNTKAKSNMEKAQSKQKNSLMQSTSHLPFKWETKCRFSIHERALDKGGS